MEDKRSEVGDAFDSPTFGKDGSFHVDKPVGSMSISPCGRDVVLASRQGLHVIDLDSPWTPPRHLQHLTPWEVADVQWSPFASRDYWVVSTSNQKALVWNLAMSTPSASIEHVLHAHTRAITDINFSAHHPDLLATCAVDAFVHCWDLRYPARPAISFCDWFAGATQVKWNRQEAHIVASSHDKMLRIWDDRKGAHPLRSIVAHSTKIYGIDWNRADSRKLVTCSLDKTIKAWDYESGSDEPERTLATAFPVWRARHTPFGQGLLAMPQRNDSNLHLYDSRPESACGSDQSMPCVKQFTGHQNHVKEFLWRARGSVDHSSDQREWQLVTWGSDLYLRLHRMTDADLELVGYERGNPPVANLQFTRRDAAYKTFREDPGKSRSPPLGSDTGTGVHRDTAQELHQRWAKPIIPPSSTALGGWISGGFVNSRFSAGSRSTAQKDLDPITWMKGVKIGKREPSMEQSFPSVTSPNFRMDRNADDFESLGDEITHVGTKFSRVEFSRVDVQKRFLQLSLHGPWGPKYSMSYLNCRIEFPIGYPRQAHPQVTIEKTATLPDETITQLQQDTQKLGATFQTFQKPSFESIVMYLQGDQTLHELTAWSNEDADASIYDFGATTDESSSDDEDDLGAFVGKQDSDLGMSGSGVLSVSNANVNVPLARTCGALWSFDGRLTCFFKQKEEPSHSLAGSFGLDDHSVFSKSKRWAYDGLGTLHPTSTVRPKAFSHGTLDSDESDSDFSSDSSEMSSSSSSWLSTQDLDTQGLKIGGHALTRPSISPFQAPERLADEARRSNPSISGTKSRTGSTKCFIAIHSLENILPAKLVLAKSYDLTGPEACTINADVARRLGFTELAEAWTVIDMVLKDTVPVKAVPLPELLETSKSVAPGDVVGIDATSSKHADWRATVKWGNHPFGKSFLVDHLFGYFAKNGDIQMLAAMSCIFYCPPPRGGQSGMQDDSEASARGKFRHTLSEALSSPSLTSPNRIDYFPSLEVAVSVLNPELPLVAGGALIKRSTFESTSLSSSLGGSTGEGSAFFPPAITPPATSRFSRRSSDQPESESYPISSSPERLKWAQRSSSQIASALSSSLNRQFFTASASSSPPNAAPKKRISPIGSYGTNQAQFAGVSSSRVFSRSLSNVEEPKPNYEGASTEHLSGGAGKARRTPRFQVRLKNQDHFFHEGYSDTSLLNISDGWRYENWRALYANLLAAWGLPLQRAEVLKYNKNSSRDVARDVLENESTGFTIGKRKPRDSSITSVNADVQVVPICSICGPKRSYPHVLGAVCVHQRYRPAPLLCLFCEEAISGRASPCLNCGHVMHAACWEIAVPPSSSPQYICLSGCGCHCGEYAQVGGNRIEPKGLAPSSTPSTIREALDPVRRESGAAVPWDHVAYESLIKNLDNFRRTNRSSWRPKQRHGSAQDP